MSLTTKTIYNALSKNFTPPSLYRTWVPFLGSGFSLCDHWAKGKDSLCVNRVNDLFWLITPTELKFVIHCTDGATFVWISVLYAAEKKQSITVSSIVLEPNEFGPIFAPFFLL